MGSEEMRGGLGMMTIDGMEIFISENRVLVEGVMDGWMEY